jgi:hypothetical protein
MAKSLAPILSARGGTKPISEGTIVDSKGEIGFVSQKTLPS